MIPYINDHPIQIAACSSRTSWEVLTLTLYLMMFLTHVQKGVPDRHCLLLSSISNSMLPIHLYHSCTLALLRGKILILKLPKKFLCFLRIYHRFSYKQMRATSPSSTQNENNILSRRARIASLQIIPKNTVLFLIFYCR